MTILQYTNVKQETHSIGLLLSDWRTYKNSGKSADLTTVGRTLG